MGAEPINFLSKHPSHATVESPAPQFAISGTTLSALLFFTHRAELIAINVLAKRAFYEIECIQGNWSLRELKRQIRYEVRVN